MNDCGTARLLFLGAKAAALVGLLLWRRIFPGETRDLAVFALTVAFGFRETLVRDPASGNVRSAGVRACVRPQNGLGNPGERGYIARPVL